MLTEERFDALWEQVPSRDTARDERHMYARAVEREARREALEEAAMACVYKANVADSQSDNEYASGAGDCAITIRALIEGEE